MSQLSKRLKRISMKNNYLWLVIKLVGYVLTKIPFEKMVCYKMKRMSYKMKAATKKKQNTIDYWRVVSQWHMFLL